MKPRRSPFSRRSRNVPNGGISPGCASTARCMNWWSRWPLHRRHGSFRTVPTMGGSMYRLMLLILTLGTLAGLLGICAVPPAPNSPQGMLTPDGLAWSPVATFSILGYDPATAEVGGAVQSRVFSVGNGVLWAEAEVGAVATQAIVDVSYGPKSLALLREGLRPAEVIKKIWEADPDPRPQDWSKQGRQF